MSYEKKAPDIRFSLRNRIALSLRTPIQTPIVIAEAKGTGH